MALKAYSDLITRIIQDSRRSAIRMELDANRDCAFEPHVFVIGEFEGVSSCESAIFLLGVADITDGDFIGGAPGRRGRCRCGVGHGASLPVVQNLHPSASLVLSCAVPNAEAVHIWKGG